jgi:leader peptidase (prepilin peptidase) / N-methyltransferase
MDTIAIGILGWLGGMLVNYLADLLPNLRRLKMPVCIYCFETQPLANYLLWPRTCPECRRRRPWRVWVVELVYILISVWLWRMPHPVLGYGLSLVLMLFFGVVVVVDIEHRLILHPVSIVGAVLCLGAGWRLHGIGSTVLGGAAGFASMYLLYLLGDLFARWLAKRRGETLDEVALGFGDVNLSGVLGLLMGWPGIVGGLILAVLLGGLVSLVYLIGMVVTRRYHSFAAIPYGPFLVASGVILVFMKGLWS